MTYTPKTLSSPRKDNPMPVRPPLCFTPLPHSIPWQPLLCFLPPWVYIFWIFHINGIIPHVTFCEWFFHLAYFSGSSMLQHVLIFHSYLFHCMYILYFTFSSIDGHLDSFYLLIMVDNAAINICIQVFTWILAFTSLLYVGD
jgi:hypothetical protein